MVTKKISWIILFVVLVIFILAVALLAPYLTNFNENVFYWLQLFLLIFFVRKLKVGSGWILYLALVSVILGAILNIFSFDFSEQVLRTSLVFWLVGILLSLKELKR